MKSRDFETEYAPMIPWYIARRRSSSGDLFVAQCRTAKEAVKRLVRDNVAKIDGYTITLLYAIDHKARSTIEQMREWVSQYGMPSSNDMKRLSQEWGVKYRTLRKYRAEMERQQTVRDDRIG